MADHIIVWGVVELEKIKTRMGLELTEERLIALFTKEEIALEYMKGVWAEGERSLRGPIPIKLLT